MFNCRAMLRTLFFTAILALGWRTAAAASSPVVLSLSYSCPDANIHIGSTVTFDMAVGMVSTSALTVPVSNTVATTDLWLSDSDIQNDTLIPSGTALLITDGTRTWAVASKVNTGATSYIDINDSEVVEGPLLGDYSQLAKNTFTVYAGSLATSTAYPGSIVWLRLGNLTFPDVTGFSDTGHLGDWRQTWTVTSIGGQYSNVPMAPYATIGGTAASLPSPLPASWEISQLIDALLPQISLLKISSISGLSSFAGMMYIGHSTQGKAVDAKNANDTAVITVDSNKPNCQIKLSVINTLPTTYVDPQGYVPIASQLAPYEGALTWSGVNGAGNFVADGQYTVQVDIQDANGVQGASATALIYVTSLQLIVKNLSLMPNQANAASTDTLLTNISYQVFLQNDDNTTLIPALQNLNWGLDLTTGTLNDYDHVHSVFAIMDVHVLNNAGVEIPAYSSALNGPDFGANVDSDSAFLARVWKNLPGPIGACTDPASYLLPAWGATVTNVAGSSIIINDGNKTNDWDNAFSDSPWFNPNISCRLKPVATDTSGNPTQLYGNWGVTWEAPAGGKPAVGQYQIYGKATLTGMDIFWAGPPTGPNVAGCDGNTDYLGNPGHCYPSSRPEVGYGSSYRGCALNGSSTIQAFTVYNPGSTVQDTTPPLLVSTSPSNGSTVNPGVFGPHGQTITASLTDASPIDTKASYITVTRSLGGLVQTLTGVTSNNGGAVVSGVNTIQLYFVPGEALTAGGTYTITIYAADTKGNSTQYTSTFVLTDQGVPSLTNVSVLNRTGASFAVYPGSLSTPLDSGAQIVAKLSMDTSVTQNFITGASLTLTRTDISPSVDESGLLGTAVLVTNTASTTLQITVPISPMLTVGTYQIVVNATAQNPSTNNVYAASYGANPVIQFSVVQPITDINVYLGSQIVLAMVEPLTVTSSTLGNINPTQIVAQSYNMTNITLPSGYVQLTGTAALNFYVNNGTPGGANPNAMTYEFQTVSPTVMTLYYNPNSVPSSVSPSTLCILGWDLVHNKLDIDGASNNTMSDFIASAVWNTSGNPCTVNITFLPGKTVRDEIFFVGYNVATNTSGTPTAVPTPAHSTRSFDPNSSDPLHNKATIYVAPYTALSGISYPTVDVKIYSMAGVLVRKFSAQTTFDNFTSTSQTNGYCYTWNGKNDSGSLVNNGIYMVVTQVHLPNGTSSTLKNLVAVIK
jgi:flagellar hook assembly protein FlgD